MIVPLFIRFRSSEKLDWENVNFCFSFTDISVWLGWKPKFKGRPVTTRSFCLRRGQSLQRIIEFVSLVMKSACPFVSDTFLTMGTCSGNFGRTHYLGVVLTMCALSGSLAERVAVRELEWWRRAGFVPASRLPPRRSRESLYPESTTGWIDTEHLFITAQW